MLSLTEAAQRTESFLTGRMLTALRGYRRVAASHWPKVRPPFAADSRVLSPSDKPVPRPPVIRYSRSSDPFARGERANGGENAPQR